MLIIDRWFGKIPKKLDVDFQPVELKDIFWFVDMTQLETSWNNIHLEPHQHDVMRSHHPTSPREATEVAEEDQKDLMEEDVEDFFLLA